jgi:hypothetical protein
LYNLVFAAPFALENLLPYELEYSFTTEEAYAVGGITGTLKKGQKAMIYNVKPARLPLKITLPGWVLPIPISF